MPINWINCVQMSDINFVLYRQKSLVRKHGGFLLIPYSLFTIHCVQFLSTEIFGGSNK